MSKALEGELMFNVCPYFFNLCHAIRLGQIEPRGICYTSSPEQRREHCSMAEAIERLNSSVVRFSVETVLRAYRITQEEMEK